MVSSTDARSEAALERILRRDRVIVIAALAAMTALAWAYTLYLANGMNMAGSTSPGTDMNAMLAPSFRPWTAMDFIVMFVMWTVMMVGMMTPSAAPMILIYARVGRKAATEGRPLAATMIFAAGYLLSWTAFSLVATALQWLLDRTAQLTPMMATNSAIAGGLVLIAAGLFQWTPAKTACLQHCESPLSFILGQGGFRRDLAGSLRIGFRHGIYCVGCCWALMALLFVGGVMNVMWIAALTIFVLLEKLVPLGRLVPRLAGAGLVVAGAALVIPAV